MSLVFFSVTAFVWELQMRMIPNTVDLRSAAIWSTKLQYLYTGLLKHFNLVISRIRVITRGELLNPSVNILVRSASSHVNIIVQSAASGGERNQ